MTLASNPTVLTGLLVGDPITSPNGDLQVLPTPTTVPITTNGILVNTPVSALIEIQSVLGTFLLPRMTSTQMNAISTPLSGANAAPVVNGMMVYTTDNNEFQFRINGAWVPFSSLGGGNVTGPESSVTNEIAIYADGTGENIATVPVTIAPVTGDLAFAGTGNTITGLASINGVFAVAAITGDITLSGNANNITGLGTLNGTFAVTATTGDITMSGSGNTITGLGTVNGVFAVTATTGDITLSGNANNITGAGTIQAANGTASAPTYSFTNGTTDGMWRISSTELGFSTAGATNFAVLAGSGTIVNYLVAQGAATGSSAQISPNATGGDANQDLALAGLGTGGVSIVPTASTTGHLKIYNEAATEYMSFITPTALAADLNYTFPSTAPTVGQFLICSAASAPNFTLSWSSAQNYQSVSGTITLTNFLALNATPLVVIAAPGAGNLIVIHKLLIQDVYGSAALAAGSAVGLQYGASADLAGTAACATIAAASFTAISANTVLAATGETTILTASATNTEVSLSYGSTSFTGGTGASFNYTIEYSIIPAT